MIKLHGFGARLGVADPSPFVLKADAYLRVRELEFTRVNAADNLNKSPKGKLPFIDDGGEIIADSQHILDYLEAKAGDDALDSWLSDEQKAQNWLVSKALDDHLYWCGIHARWVREDTWPVVREAFFGKMPWLLRKVVPGLVRREMKKSLKAHGMGRHAGEEIQAFSHRTLQSLSDLLGDQDYYFGSRISTLDIAAFAFLAQFILAETDNPFTQDARGFGNLVAYCERFQQQYYPEFV